MSIAECKNVTKRFGKITALRGLSLTIPKNSFFGIIGPNGAGKTTTLRIILGLLRPDEGEVMLYGEDPWDNPRVKAMVGVLHENPVYPLYISCERYLLHVARIYGVEKPEIRVTEVLKLVELYEARSRLIKALSAGMLQRLGLAQALIHMPKLVIADEPTSNLDPLARARLLNLMRQLREDEGVDFIVSSHILPELARVCEKVAFVSEGEIKAAGSLEELYKQFGLTMFRVSSDAPRKLLAELVELPYIEGITMTGFEVLVKVKEGFEQQFYSDVAEVAKKVGVKLFGVDFKVASLEELYRRVIVGGFSS